MNFIDQNLTLMLRIMTQLADKIPRDFLGNPEKRLYSSEYELLKDIKSTHGRSKDIIRLMRQEGLIKKNKSGQIFYDVDYGFKLIKMSDFFQKHKT